VGRTFDISPHISYLGFTHPTPHTTPAPTFHTDMGSTSCLIPGPSHTAPPHTASRTPHTATDCAAAPLARRARLFPLPTALHTPLRFPTRSAAHSPATAYLPRAGGFAFTCLYIRATRPSCLHTGRHTPYLPLLRRPLLDHLHLPSRRRHTFARTHCRGTFLCTPHTGHTRWLVTPRSPTARRLAVRTRHAAGLPAHLPFPLAVYLPRAHAPRLPLPTWFSRVHCRTRFTAGQDVPLQDAYTTYTTRRNTALHSAAILLLTLFLRTIAVAMPLQHYCSVAARLRRSLPHARTAHTGYRRSATASTLPSPFAFAIYAHSFLYFYYRLCAVRTLRLPPFTTFIL